MSFKFDWSRVSTNKEFLNDLKSKINSALEQALADNDNYGVSLKNFDLGSSAPELQIIKITELKQDKMHLVFAFSYCGDASMELDVNLQVNPLVSSKGRVGRLGRTHMGLLAAHIPLRCSIYTALSKFQLEGTLDLAVDINTEETTTTEEIEVTSPPSSILMKSKEVIKEKLKNFSNGSKMEKSTYEFHEVVKPKKKKR